MREMKNSGVEWIGEIPTEWTVVPLSYYFREHKCKNIGNTATNVLSLSYGKIIRRNVSNNMGLLPESFETYNVVEPGQIVLRLTDMQNDQRSLRTGLVTEHGIITSAYLTLTTNSLADNRFFHYLLHTYDTMKIIYNMGNGVRQNLKFSELAKLPVLVPNEAEQSHMADYLDAKCAKIDAAIAHQQNAVEKLKVFKQQLITETVRNGLHGEPLARSHYFWVGDVPQSWQVGQLKYFCSIRAGLTLGKKYPEGSELVEMPYLRVANVQGEYVDLSDVATVAVLPEEVEKYRLHPGELLMTEGGDRDKLGRGCVWNGEIDPCLHQNHVFAVTTDSSRLLAHFLDYVTTSDIARSYFDYTAKKTTNLASTNSTTIMQFRIPVPPVQEQQEIVDYLDVRCAKVNKAMEQRNAIIAKLNEYKKSLIYEVVTGKQEV